MLIKSTILSGLGYSLANRGFAEEANLISPVTHGYIPLQIGDIQA